MGPPYSVGFFVNLRGPIPTFQAVGPFLPVRMLHSPGLGTENSVTTSTRRKNHEDFGITKKGRGSLPVVFYSTILFEISHPLRIAVLPGSKPEPGLQKDNNRLTTFDRFSLTKAGYGNQRKETWTSRPTKRFLWAGGEGTKSRRCEPPMQGSRKPLNNAKGAPQSACL